MKIYTDPVLPNLILSKFNGRAIKLLYVRFAILKISYPTPRIAIGIWHLLMHCVGVRDAQLKIHLMRVLLRMVRSSECIGGKDDVKIS